MRYLWEGGLSTPCIYTFNSLERDKTEVRPYRDFL
jgi:hypothetical protein